MKKLIITGLLTAFLVPGCVVAVESRHPRHNPPPPPPPPPPAQVTVEWHDARTIVLREYYGCDWDTVGAFEYYEDVCGIPEDDLFFLLHVSRYSNRDFHEVVYTYDRCNRVLWDVSLHYRFNHWDLYIDLPNGTVCPPAYHRAYGYYWHRHQHPRFVLSNHEFHALFWLRFSVNYYGWQPRDCFDRWDRCVDNRVRYVTVVHREYPNAGRGGYNWARRPVVRVIERPERDRTIVVQKRVEVVKRVEVDVKQRGSKGQQVIRPPSRDERDRRIQEDRRHVEVEWKREREERDRDPRKYVPADRKDGDRNDEKRDDPKDRKDERRNPPPPPKKNPPPPPKNDKKDGDGKPDDRKDERDDRRDDRKDERKNPPPPPKKNPPPPPKEDKKGDDRKDNDRKEDREDRRDERKDDRKDPPPPPPKKNPPPPPKDDKKDDDRKDNDRKEDREDRRDDRKDDRKDPPPPPPKKNPPPPKEDKKEQDQKKNDKKDDQRNQQRRPPPPPKERKQDAEKRQDQKQDNRQRR